MGKYDHLVPPASPTDVKPMPKDFRPTLVFRPGDGGIGGFVVAEVRAADGRLCRVSEALGADGAVTPETQANMAQLVWQAVEADRIERLPKDAGPPFVAG